MDVSANGGKVLDDAMVLLDTQGRFEQPVVMGGPESLRAAALETIKAWTATPPLVNGSPVFWFTTLRVTFLPPPPAR